jgi:hypothetical protein
VSSRSHWPDVVEGQLALRRRAVHAQQPRAGRQLRQKGAGECGLADADLTLDDARHDVAEAVLAVHGLVVGGVQVRELRVASDQIADGQRLLLLFFSAERAAQRVRVQVAWQALTCVGAQVQRRHVGPDEVASHHAVQAARDQV